MSMRCLEQMIQTADEGMYWDEEYQDKEMFEWYKRLLQVPKAHTCIVEKGSGRSHHKG